MSVVKRFHKLRCLKLQFQKLTFQFKLIIVIQRVNEQQLAQQQQLYQMSLLSNADNSRMVKDAPLPYRNSLTKKQLFRGKFIDVEKLMQFFEKEGVLDIYLVSTILKQAKQIFNMQPNILYIDDPLTVIGDIHGQYYDLIEVLKMHKNKNFHGKQESKYLFLGDYVDRGLFAIQVMLLILSMKINEPKKVLILRGNHQCRQLTTYFNFRHQCLDNYNQQIYEEFMEVFCSLPLAAIVNRRFLCIHGGISTNIKDIEDIMKINRFCEIPQNGLFCDLVWADPVQQYEAFNETRGCSYIFGYGIVKKFLRNNKLCCIIRAHEAKQQGFQMHMWAGPEKFPPVITLFSAPNYCDFYNNKGAILKIQNNILQVKQIKGQNHPFYLPNNPTLFEWSIPFLAEKVTQMFKYLLEPENEIESNGQILIELVDRQKIIEELLKMQQQEVESKMQFVKFQGKVLGDELFNIEEAREYAMNVYQKDFSVQKSIDKINEKRPSKEQDQLNLMVESKLAHNLGTESFGL